MNSRNDSKNNSVQTINNNRIIERNNWSDYVELLVKESQARGLSYFIPNVFCLSFDDWVGGDYIDNVARRMDKYSYTIDVAPRDHFKSARVYADVMLKIFTSTKNHEGLYVSYTHGMAFYHLKKIRRLIENNPAFCYLKDLAPASKGKIEYSWGNNIVVNVECQGMDSFKRGIHADTLWIDDPYTDEKDKLRANQVMAVNQVFKEQLIPMIKKGGSCRIVGTPQTRKDIFFETNLDIDFKRTIADAIINESKKQVLWPEWRDWDYLQRRRLIIGENSFSQEYRCKPAHEIDAFLNPDHVNAAIDPKMTKSTSDSVGAVFAGYDPAEKQHAAHGALFSHDGLETKQLVSKFWDRRNYHEQLEWWRWAIDHYDIQVVVTDNTNQVFSAMESEGTLPPQFELKTFSRPYKYEIAHGLDALLTQNADKNNPRKIRLLPDERQKNHLLSVNNDLDSIITSDAPGKVGHGDAFWSISMALSEIGQDPKLLEI